MSFFAPNAIAESEVTEKSIYKERRAFLAKSIMLSLGSMPVFSNAVCINDDYSSLNDKLTPKKNATRYNNYYEFSSEKTVIHILAKSLTTRPWKIKLFGELERELEIDIDRLSKLCQYERVYRFRCVEGWSMVVPWNGFLLRDLIRLVKPLSSAKYIQLIGLHRPSEMIGQRRPLLEWPYIEGLRMDEAMHPLTMVATGMYGESLPPQNGAPLRLVVPWKYGYKSIKAFQAIKFVSTQPTSSWMAAVPKEYDFYANVNPNVPHPRWSQRREVPLGGSRKQKTLLYNGYADQVAQLYPPV